jgi:hypothetical protein
MSKDIQVGSKRKAEEEINYSDLEEFFRDKINKTEPQNPEAHLQPKKTKDQKCEPLKSSPSNSMGPRGDKSPSRLTSVVRNLGL